VSAETTWDRFCRQLCEVPELGLSVDPSLIELDEPFLAQMEAPLSRALDEMAALEKGAIANADEQRMVGHYWLRAPKLAPTPEITREIEATLRAVRAFARAVHGRRVKPQRAPAFRRLLCLGIGGSALGPMFVADALGKPGKDRLSPAFLDNTDPDGFARAFARLGPALRETLVVVTSKSGGTPETRNGLLAAQAAFRAARLDFARHAVAITQAGSAMDELAVEQGWLARFPMWDWVGGRTSELSAVGLLPAALQGLDVPALLAGAAACDQATRARDPFQNPAALLALCWFRETAGQGNRAMVVLPYKDRLLLFSRYLQQLVMESLGKRLDREGRRTDQGISVYGNKGSTDQHAYVQQLRDGVHDFFAVLLRVRASGGKRAEVEPGVTAGDYLHGFLLGTRAALHENGRRSITISVPRVDARTVGGLIALFERAVGLYASLVGVNAYHQPGVEAGKKAAAGVLELQRRLAAALGKEPRTAEELASRLGEPDVEAVWLLCEHLEANGRARKSGSGPVSSRFSALGRRR